MRLLRRSVTVVLTFHWKVFLRNYIVIFLDFLRAVLKLKLEQVRISISPEQNLPKWNWSFPSYCTQNNGKFIFFFQNNPEGVISATFENVEQSDLAVKSLNGRVVDGRCINVALWDGKTKYYM